jgi:hypothetical protein
MDWIHLAQESDKWQSLMNTVINFHVPENKENLLVSWGTITFPRRNLFRGVMCFLRHREQGSRYRDQSANSVDRCLLWQSHETHQHTLLALRTVNSVKADSTHYNYCLKGVKACHHIFLCKNFYNIKTEIIKTEMGSEARSLGASDLEDSTDAFLLVMYRLPRPLNYRHLVRLQKCKKCNHLNAVTEAIKASMAEERYDIKLCCFISYIRITFH